MEERSAPADVCMNLTLYDLLNSNFFQTVVTVLVGLIAYAVYERQKSDLKKNAATSILLEVQNAERVISRIKESVRNGRLEIDYKLIQSNNWNKYQHLFSRDFDKDEWDEITDFYNKSILLDEAIRYNSLAFGNDVEQIRSNKQRVLADFAKDLITEASGKSPIQNDELQKMLNEFNEKVKAFDQTYMGKQGEFAYYPIKPINDAKIYLEDLKKISTSSVGQKLKKLAK